MKVDRFINLSTEYTWLNGIESVEKFDDEMWDSKQNN